MEISIETFSNLIVHFGIYAAVAFLFFQILYILVDALKGEAPPEDEDQTDDHQWYFDKDGIVKKKNR